MKKVILVLLFIFSINVIFAQKKTSIIDSALITWYTPNDDAVDRYEVQKKTHNKFKTVQKTHPKSNSEAGLYAYAESNFKNRNEYRVLAYMKDGSLWYCATLVQSNLKGVIVLKKSLPLFSQGLFLYSK